MKKILLLFAAVLFSIAASAQAVAKFDKTSHNFGTIAPGQAQTVTFNFTNTGDRPLIVQQVFTSCGCTAAEYTKTEVAPGAKGTVTVKFDGKNPTSGTFTKTITVRTNASNSIVRLTIEGTIKK
ncbi:MAG: DUF1573 domain-containing protein [Bacteroidaceae bacterium]|nr:DUF1573 domain-containing protein [Bacteroidaceae bacterium]